ncbi:hypothetical protein SAMN04487969_11843 [Paenibacillus algorifonticola]|uniref:Uncharacterized protein n=1 Tax=Paenibacillus algorifonticola TaxID=684063 RepID=A0A1I2GU02_9BACL|nr:hypothetical protein [Paenibacillus algorifonticola]SFF20942.1 hypothetical protein SAMN04487969_11843 [Paenibacillus algorifonticola]
MLDLNSSIWSKLEGPYGFADSVPEMLQQLTQNYDSEVKDELYWEQLYHQNTIYPCTYAAVPYLAEIARLSNDPEVKLDIYITCGLFEANNTCDLTSEMPAVFEELVPDIDTNVRADIYLSYYDAIKRLGEMSEQVAAYAQPHKDDSEKRYIAIADAAFHGERAAAGMLQTHSEGDEYVAACPACDNETFIWPDESGEKLVAYKADPVFNGKDAPAPIIPADPASSEESSLRYVHSRAECLEDEQLKAQLPYLAGHMNCPACGEEFRIWEQLLALYD